MASVRNHNANAAIASKLQDDGSGTGEVVSDDARLGSARAGATKMAEGTAPLPIIN